VKQLELFPSSSIFIVLFSIIILGIPLWDNRDVALSKLGKNMTTVFQETEWEENVTAGYIAISFVIWVILDYLDSPFYTYFAWTAFLFYICISGFQDVLRRRKVKVHGTEEYAEQSGYFGTIYMARKDRQKEEKLTVDEILFSACMIMTTVSIWIIVAEWVGDLYGFIAALAVYIVSI